MKSIWMPIVRWREVTEDGINGGAVMPANYSGSADSIEQLRANIMRAGIVGRLVSSDFQSTMIIAPLLEIDPKTGKKKTAMMTLKEYMNDDKDNFRVVGTAMYAALAAHLPNKKYLKKDDIESLLFLLSYFGMGQHPWRYKTNQEGLEKMMHYKFEIKPKELFPPNVFPPQFAKLYEYIRFIPDD